MPVQTPSPYSAGILLTWLAAVFIVIFALEFFSWSRHRRHRKTTDSTRTAKRPSRRKRRGKRCGRS